MFDFRKSFLIVVLIGLFCSFNAVADKEKEEKKEKVEIEPEKKKCSETDSLAVQGKQMMAKDSVENRKHAPSSMSSMSYNILFQVIYRYSFKEIFESPAASEIVTN